MILTDLIAPDEILEIGTALYGLTVSSVTCDSREVTEGCLFIAVRGTAADGHAFIGQALENGAAAVAAEYIPEGIPRETARRIVRVKESRKTLALAAARFYGHPAREMTLVGVTGTNGKTTITYLLESIFNSCGFKTGVMGTINIRYPGVSLDNPVTTPDPVRIQKSLRQMREAGVTHAVMEVSSHSLAQHRVDGCEFAACIFTNLTQDHLDYHRDMEDYFACKKKLFTDFTGKDGRPVTAVVHTGDAYGKKLAKALSTPVIRVSRQGDADVKALSVRDEITGLSFTLEAKGRQVPIFSGLTGSFNLENILCAAAAALSTGIPLESVATGIRNLSRVPGRLEKLPLPLNRHVFVDYAHTPGALASILSTLAERVPARLITVFGCGGDRDTTKRVPMGRAACRYSDIAIVTSDNPRSENPEAIVAEIVTGIREAGFSLLDPENIGSGVKGYLVEVDREKALNLAMKISKPADTIVAAGKGHETYQITNAGKIHFDDVEKLTEACQRLLAPIPWSARDLSHALDCDPADLATQVRDLQFSGIGTDSRTIDPAMVFLAIEGDRFDGHDFIPALVGQGIRAFVIREGFPATLDPEVRTRAGLQNTLFFEVPDTLAALGRLGRFQRDRSRAKIVAITGSNGKTTTRKMTREIFGTRFDTLATQGNLNNEIGLPLTLLRLSPVHEWAVVEMGMNHPGEIGRLSAIARPDIALITNTSGAHLEGLKTADNVARAKAEIFDGMAENGTAILFADDPRRAIMETRAKSNPNISRLFTFGTDEAADFRPGRVELTREGLSFTLIERDVQTPIRLNTPAEFMVTNALAAAAIARVAGIPAEAVPEGLAAFTPVKGRMNLTTLSFGVRLIDDTYNANPASMTQALKTLGRLGVSGKTYAALGDMLELGPDSERFHREIGVLAASVNPTGLYLFGPESAHIMAGALEKGYPESKIFKGSKSAIAKDLVQVLAQDLAMSGTEGPWLLLKGSRGMAMETIIPELETLYQQNKEAL